LETAIDPFESVSPCPLKACKTPLRVNPEQFWPWD